MKFFLAFSLIIWYNMLMDYTVNTNKDSLGAHQNRVIHTPAGLIFKDYTMKYIKLTKGQWAVVDDEEYKWLSKYNWCAYQGGGSQDYYAIRNSKKSDGIINGKRYLISMAREILRLKRGDKLEADHINHITLDNRMLNLRSVTSQQNKWNRKNTKGYYWSKIVKKYVARIKINCKTFHIGVFCTKEAARKAYLDTKKILHRFN